MLTPEQLYFISNNAAMGFDTSHHTSELIEEVYRLRKELSEIRDKAADAVT
jgi:hypothetical protein